MPGLLLFSACGVAAGARSLGLEEVRLGPVVPSVSLWWVVVPCLFALFCRVRRPRRLAVLGAALTLAALAMSLALSFGVVNGEPPPKAVAVYDLSRPGDDPIRNTSLHSLEVLDRAQLNRIADRRVRVALDVSGYVMVTEPGLHRFAARCDDRCSLDIDDRTVLSGQGSVSGEVALRASLHRFRLRYEQQEGQAVLELGWDRPGRIDVLPLNHYVSDRIGLLTAPSLKARETATLVRVLSSTFYWLAGFCVAWWVGERARFRHHLAAARRQARTERSELADDLQTTERLDDAEPRPESAEGTTARAVLLAAALNLPFALFHPDGPIMDNGLLRSLAVNAVLFLVPGFPVAVALFGRRRWGVWLPWGLVFSLVIFAAIISVFHSAGFSVTSGGAWNASWVVTNLGWIACLLSHRLDTWNPSIERRALAIGGALFVGAYVLFFWGAERVVPPQSDHDFEVQATGYSLLTRLEPLLLTDRQTFYYFAHPLLLHVYVAGSFLYFDELEHLAFYDEASRRALAAKRGEPFDPPPTTGHRRIVAVLGSDYVVDPPLQDGSERVSVMSSELRQIYEHYAKAPHKLATRTPNVLLAALTVSLLGLWVGRIAPAWIALLVGLVYATSPEVFVRSSYGGYFAVSNFSVMLTLLAMERFSRHPEKYSYATCFLASCLTALANHKLVLIPVALGFWQIFRAPRRWRSNLPGVLKHPAILGFFFGTTVFWAYGAAIDFQSFWLEHVRTHLADRLMHHNPLGYTGYPGPLDLWVELWKHTGYLLLPLGVSTLVLATRRDPRDCSEGISAGLLLTWFSITAIVFTAVDWRMTKHLMPLMLPLFLAPVLWARSRRARLTLVGLLLSLVGVWNCVAIHGLAVNFGAFQITPAW